MKSLLKRILTWFFDWCDDISTPQGTSRKSNKRLYKFKGRIFWCEPETVERLNKALAMSSSEDRYKKVHTPSTRANNEENRAS
jgi:hypothetical protein